MVSCFYLCSMCEHMRSHTTETVECAKRGTDKVKVMIDHGHKNGRRPYDDPIDVCPDFVHGDDEHE